MSTGQRRGGLRSHCNVIIRELGVGESDSVVHQQKGVKENNRLAGGNDSRGNSLENEVKKKKKTGVKS